MYHKKSILQLIGDQKFKNPPRLSDDAMKISDDAGKFKVVLKS